MLQFLTFTIDILFIVVEVCGAGLMTAYCWKAIKDALKKKD